MSEEGRGIFVEGANRNALEEALGMAVVDEQTLYRESEARSLGASLNGLGLDAELAGRRGVAPHT